MKHLFSKMDQKDVVLYWIEVTHHFSVTTCVYKRDVNTHRDKKIYCLRKRLATPQARFCTVLSHAHMDVSEDTPKEDTWIEEDVSMTDDQRQKPNNEQETIPGPMWTLSEIRRGRQDPVHRFHVELLPPTMQREIDKNHFEICQKVSFSVRTVANDPLDAREHDVKRALEEDRMECDANVKRTCNKEMEEY